MSRKRARPEASWGWDLPSTSLVNVAIGQFQRHLKMLCREVRLSNHHLLCGVLWLVLNGTVRGGLRVLRIGEPAKVRSCLQRFTLKAQLADAVTKDENISEARREQQQLRKQLRQSRRSCEYTPR